MAECCGSQLRYKIKEISQSIYEGNCCQCQLSWQPAKKVWHVSDGTGSLRMLRNNTDDLSSVRQSPKKCRNTKIILIESQINNFKKKELHRGSESLTSNEQPHLPPNTLNCLRGAISLMGAYTLTSAGYKKDFNKGVLPVAHIWSHIEEGSGVKHHNPEQISRLLVRERSSEQLQN